VLFHLVQRRLELKDAVASEGLSRAWEERKVGVGGRVRGLVVERLRMNARMGVVGRWQEVCLHFQLSKGGQVRLDIKKF
jgi:hypothetical protein